MRWPRCVTRPGCVAKVRRFGSIVNASTGLPEWGGPKQKEVLKGDRNLRWKGRIKSVAMLVLQFGVWCEWISKTERQLRRNGCGGRTGGLDLCKSTTKLEMTSCSNYGECGNGEGEVGSGLEPK